MQNDTFVLIFCLLSNLADKSNQILKNPKNSKKVQMDTYSVNIPFEFFLNNTNLTLLAVLYKIDIEGFQNQQK